jgi:hypothetical protein
MSRRWPRAAAATASGAPDELADAAQRQRPELPDAELLVVAGTLNVVSDFQELADPPDARPLR